MIALRVHDDDDKDDDDNDNDDDDDDDYRFLHITHRWIVNLFWVELLL